MHTLPIPQVLPTLQNDLLTLRMMEDADAQDLFGIYGDPCVMKHTGESPFASLKTVDEMLASVRKLLLEGSSLEWAIVLRSKQTVIGTCGLYHFDPIVRSAEVGCLLERKSWSLGYMTEALSLMVNFVAKELDLRLLLADVAAQNVRAQRMFHRLGYIPTESRFLAKCLGADCD